MVMLNEEEKMIEFVSFCIESYKMAYHQSGKEVAHLFQKLGVIQFLRDGYMVLHSQDKKFIIEEIDLFLKNRGAVI